jgi:hypothetical protein
MLPSLLGAFFTFFCPVLHYIMKNIYLFILLLFTPVLVFSQNFYRISGEFSIKGKTDNQATLIMGKFYYDKNEKKIIHQNLFPEKATWITSDTNLYKIVNNKLILRQTIPDLTLFSMYHMVLNNQLNNFGLEGSIFKLENVENENGLVISTWIPPKSMKKFYGKILISTKDDNLFGIIFYDPQDVMLKKQFFEDYSVINGLAFPGTITEITYKDGKENYQVTTYKNIRVNDRNEEAMYHFNISDY